MKHCPRLLCSLSGLTKPYNSGQKQRLKINLEKCNKYQKEAYIYIIKQTQNAMTQEMINTVTARVNEMKSNVEIQKIMMSFSSNDDAYNWLVKAAIATLMGAQNEK